MNIIAVKNAEAIAQQKSQIWKNLGRSQAREMMILEIVVCLHCKAGLKVMWWLSDR
ncbi:MULTISPECIES: hypothetical protein [Nostocales]|uniref:hypothetical protein n=1 Tax=Nostocales TaxID=1161 RepID=UPI0012902F8C